MTEESPHRAFARTVGARIAAIRAARGISQEELGFRAEMHRTNVGQLERGERVPRLDSATKIASALGVSVDVLVEEIDWKPPALVPAASPIRNAASRDETKNERDRG